MSFFRFLYSVNDGLKSAGSAPEWKYEDLETTPYLYGSDYLNDLYTDAGDDPWKQNAVYGHMKRYDVLGVGCEGYDRLERRHFANKDRRGR